MNGIHREQLLNAVNEKEKASVYAKAATDKKGKSKKKEEGTKGQRYRDRSQMPEEKKSEPPIAMITLIFYDNNVVANPCVCPD